MNRTLAVAAAGMATQQVTLDAITANLANVDVPGFRASRAEFSLFLDADGRAIAPQQSSQRLFSQGRLDFTDNPNDLAIQGDGFFAVRNARGAVGYTRAGNFSGDEWGYLRLPNGARLEGVKLPSGSTSFEVDERGQVRARVAGRAASVVAGHIRLANFPDSAGLRLDTDGLFYSNARSGPAALSTPDGTSNRLKQRVLERANVSVVAAMMAVLAAQRAYEANAKAVQAADEMLRLANNLERS
ncbi:MAG TPA: flagellar hook-basal body protein [Candidatus Eremiobacteraceae bacterium]|nr:flagellar hook-basal body protein [Candidatus Eremiobacteraceae bacterium]